MRLDGQEVVRLSLNVDVQSLFQAANLPLGQELRFALRSSSVGSASLFLAGFGGWKTFWKLEGVNEADVTEGLVEA